MGAPDNGRLRLPRLAARPLVKDENSIMNRKDISFAGVVTRRQVLALSAGAATPVVLKVGGTGSMVALLGHVGDAMSAETAGLRLMVVPSLGSSGGIKAVVAGAIDLALTGRPPKPEETAAGLEHTLLGRTGLVLAVGPNRPDTALSTRQLLDIFHGRATTWPDGEPIRIVLRPESDIDTFLLRNWSPAMAEAVDEARKRPGMVTGATDQESAEAIQKIPGAIGTIALAQIQAERLSLRPITLDGHVPTLADLGRVPYPIEKPIYVVTRAGAASGGGTIRRFLASPAGHRLLDSFAMID